MVRILGTIKKSNLCFRHSVSKCYLLLFRHKCLGHDLLEFVLIDVCHGEHFLVSVGDVPHEGYFVPGCILALSLRAVVWGRGGQN